jgi:hypothetical protein
MFKKILGIVFLVSGVWGMIASASAQTESITFTTYYPSPYGVYKNLRIYPSSDCNPSNACSNEGEICYYSSATVPERGLKVCSPDPANPNTLIWTALGGAGGGGWWTRTVTNTGTTNLYPNEPTWNVGIGTTNPKAPLDVKNAMVVRVGGGTDYIVVDGTGTVSTHGGASLYLVSDTGRAILLRPGGVDRMYLKSDGNVGIGTTNPTSKLDVVGQIRANTINITGGSPGAGKVLTSNAVGLASWQSPPPAITYSGGQSYTYPGGLIIKMGTFFLPNGDGFTTITYGTPFPHNVVSATSTCISGLAHNCEVAIESINNAATLLISSHILCQGCKASWIAIGW